MSTRGRSGGVAAATGRTRPPRNVTRLRSDTSAVVRAVVVGLVLVEVVALVDVVGWSAVGSSVRCQPSRHWCIRSRFALAAQAGHRESRVDPHGIGTAVTVPVARSVTLRSSGRTQTPADSANATAMSVVTITPASEITPHHPRPRWHRQGRPGDRGLLPRGSASSSCSAAARLGLVRHPHHLRFVCGLRRQGVASGSGPEPCRDALRGCVRGAGQPDRARPAHCGHGGDVRGGGVVGGPR